MSNRTPALEVMGVSHCLLEGILNPSLLPKGAAPRDYSKPKLGAKFRVKLIRVIDYMEDRKKF